MYYYGLNAGIVAGGGTGATGCLRLLRSKKAIADERSMHTLVALAPASAALHHIGPLPVHRVSNRNKNDDLQRDLSVASHSCFLYISSY